MKSLIILLAAAALASCAEPPLAETPRPGSMEAEEGAPVTNAAESLDAGIPAGCSLKIAFGSYAMGIDRETLHRVEALLEADPAVTGVSRSPWGREGEVTLCAAVRSDADRDRLFAALSALFPRRPRGPLSVTTNDGREFQANEGI